MYHLCNQTYLVLNECSMCVSRRNRFRKKLLVHFYYLGTTYCTDQSQGLTTATTTGWIQPQHGTQQASPKKTWSTYLLTTYMTNRRAKFLGEKSGVSRVGIIGITRVQLVRMAVRNVAFFYWHLLRKYDSIEAPSPKSSAILKARTN